MACPIPDCAESGAMSTTSPKGATASNKERIPLDEIPSSFVMNINGLDSLMSLYNYWAYESNETSPILSKFLRENTYEFATFGKANNAEQDVQMMTTQELRSTVSQITQENIRQASSWMTKLSEQQLNWRPNPGIWSISEILAHLNSYARYYHPAILAKIQKTRFRTPKEEFLSSPLGRSAWKSMQLGRANNVKRKFKAPKGHNPTVDPRLVSGSDVQDFLSSQQELLEIVEKSMTVNIRKVKVPISISKIVRLRLGDAMLFITYHNERHMQQILNLKTNKNFPHK